METDWDLVDAALHNPSAMRQPAPPPSTRPAANTSRRRSVPYTTSSPRPRAPPHTASSPTTSQSPRSNEDRNMQLALHHARLIQQRKEIEASILQSTIALIDYPLSTPQQPAPQPAASPRRSSRVNTTQVTNSGAPNSSSPPDPAANPSPSDAASVKEHLRHFQPADYDALIRERNIEQRCGYVLCPRTVAESGRHTGKFALLTGSSSGGQGGGRGDLRVIETAQLMRWCERADECARRAMYLRVQLDETPAWERHQGTSLRLYDEDRAEKTAAAAATANGEGDGVCAGAGLPPLNLDGRSEEEREQAVARMTADLKKLALERGSPGVDRLMSEFQNMSIPHR